MAQPNGTEIRVTLNNPISGLVIAVVSAVVVSLLVEWLVRVRDRRRVIEDATLELVMVLPHVVSALSERRSSEHIDTSLGSEWGKQREQLLLALSRIRGYTKWPIWRYRKIRAEADRVLAQMTVAELNRHHTTLSRDEMEVLMSGEMFSLVFGNRPLLDEAIRNYQQFGFGNVRRT